MKRIDEARAQRVLEALSTNHPNTQLLICDPWAIYYLTGFYAEMYERFSGLLLAPNVRPVIFMNALNDIGTYENADVVIYTDTDDVTEVIASKLNPNLPLGIDATMRCAFLLPLQERHAAPSFFLGSEAVDRARSIKDENERELMRISSRINDEVMICAASLVHEGVTELEIADQLLDLYRSRGCQGFSFNPIVSFGAHAADPHHEPDQTPLKSGEVVLFDIGGRYQGYCSDMTRTFFWGDVDSESQRIYDIVRRANEAAEALIRPGARFCDLDRAARELITDAGYGPYFTHRLGHSIGLQDHEPGDVSSVNEAILEPGMTFSIEPGIYLPGHTGVRIEDLTLVTETGVEILNTYTHEPVSLS